MSKVPTVGVGGSVAQTFNSSTNNAWSFMARRADLHTYGFRLYGSGGSDVPEFNDASIHNAGVLVLTFGYGKRTLHFNNSVLIEQTDSGSIRAHNTVPLTIGGHSGGANGANIYLSEFLVYNQVVGGIDQEIMEGYLGHKWGVAGSLPMDTCINHLPHWVLKHLKQVLVWAQINWKLYTQLDWSCSVRFIITDMRHPIMVALLLGYK